MVQITLKESTLIAIEETIRTMKEEHNTEINYFI